MRRRSLAVCLSHTHSKAPQCRQAKVKQAARVSPYHLIVHGVNYFLFTNRPEDSLERSESQRHSLTHLSISVCDMSGGDILLFECR